MVNFGQDPQKQTSYQNLKPADTSDIATAEYSFFHIHQIKAWSGWSVNQEEVDYIIDPPLSVNS